MAQKILIVDDEKDFIDMLAERLMAKGFNIVEAFNGKDGLDKAHAEKPDVIVLDLTMPEMSGYDVCRKLKIDKNYKDIPIIMLTGKFQPNDIEFGREMGADAYLTKPLELKALSHKIDALLRLRDKNKKIKGVSR
ncbi:MAG: response regulator [Candidatus Omnitrophota bacterium]